MYNKDLISSYLVDFIKTNKLKYKEYKFASGAIIIDLWKSDNFYSIQIKDEGIGFSIMKENNSDFSTIPDKLYSSFELFKNDLIREIGIVPN